MPREPEAPIVKAPLKGENCPISQCPEDILKMIFELAGKTPDKHLKVWHYDFTHRKGQEKSRFRTSRDISQVYQRWRYISLDTPSIWSYIKISCKVERSPSSIKAFWDRSCSRVKSFPATIYLIITPSIYPYQLINISKIPVIQSLRIKLPDKQCYQIVLDILDQAKVVTSHPEDQDYQETQVSLDSPRAMHCSIRELRVSGLHFILIRESGPPWEVGELLGRLPLLQTLQIIGCGVLRLSNPLNHSLHNLEIFSISSLDLFSLLSCLPELRTLKLEDVKWFQNWPEGTIKLPHLTTFGFARWPNDGIAWMGQLSCPVLQNFTGNPRYTMDCYPEAASELLSFISSHRSIKYFGFMVCPQLLTRLGSVAPQIEELSFEFRSNELEQISKGLFSNLWILHIVDPRHNLARLAFEQLVRTRCLPSSHPQSKLVSGLSPLAELHIKYRNIIASEHRQPDWLASELIRDASSVMIKENVEAWFSWVDYKEPTSP